MPTHLPLAALRSPSFLPDFLFESHYTYWLIALAIAAACLYVAHSRAQKPPRLIAYALFGLTALWIAAAFIFDTPSERLYHAHKSLAAAAATADIDAMLPFFAPDFHCPALTITAAPAARTQLGDRLKSDGIKSSTITFYKSEITGKNATTDLTLITQTDAAGPIRTSWQLFWSDNPAADWQIEEADLVRLGDQEVSTDQALRASAKSFPR